MIVFNSNMGTMMPRPQLPFLLKKEGAEAKVPKGVPLDFDINSVAKQVTVFVNYRLFVQAILCGFLFPL